MNFRIEWHDRLNSTNSYIREHILRHKCTDSGFVVAAREQTAGRGRSDRKWLSTPNSNLCCSLFLKTDVELMQVPSLTMAAALAVNDFLNELRIDAAPKWPNDILVGEKKICGILSERVENETTKGIIVGIGLNINMTSEEADAIDRPATSILIESGEAHAPDQILQRLLPQLEFWINRWNQGGFSAIREVWTEKAGPIGKPISVHDGDIRKNGTLAGFGSYGELLLQTNTGFETIWSGDVS